MDQLAQMAVPRRLSKLAFLNRELKVLRPNIDTGAAVAESLGLRRLQSQWPTSTLVEGLCKSIVGFRSPNVISRVRVKRLQVYISMSVGLETFVSFGIAYGLPCIL